VDLEDLHQAIDRTKGIQREWKEVGMTPMKVDRRLWKEFRGACDAVFARLDAQREERNAAMSAQIEEAEGLARQARTLLDSDSDDERLHLKRDLGTSALRRWRVRHAASSALFGHARKWKPGDAFWTG
jgi:hypothetical protein